MVLERLTGLVRPELQKSKDYHVVFPPAEPKRIVELVEKAHETLQNASQFTENEFNDFSSNMIEILGGAFVQRPDGFHFESSDIPHNLNRVFFMFDFDHDMQLIMKPDYLDPDDTNIKQERISYQKSCKVFIYTATISEDYHPQLGSRLLEGPIGIFQKREEREIIYPIDNYYLKKICSKVLGSYRNSYSSECALKLAGSDGT